MKTAYDIIIRPVITEKSMEAVADKKYVFEVAKDANKVEIRKAIEQIFGVKVLSVNTINVPGKATRGRTGRLEESDHPSDRGFQDHRAVRGYGLIGKTPVSDESAPRALPIARRLMRCRKYAAKPRRKTKRN